MKEIKYNEEDVVDHHAVLAIIKNKAGDILMQEHLKYGFWTIPGGKVKLGQDIFAGLKNEIFEECNLRIDKCSEVIFKEIFYDRGGRKVKVTEHIFEVVSYNGIMKNKEPEKHSEQKFLSINEIKNLPYLSDVTLLYLEKIGIKRKPRL
jgi:8-oxo-dGTP pyrophosphatase MutT (NUDIX family)